MEIKSAEFVISNTDYKLCPQNGLPEYAFIGRSNVGKSSLINMRLASRPKIIFVLLVILLLALFLADLAWGSIHISIREIFDVFSGRSENSINNEILMNFRLPKAITALIAGASLSVAGLMMQTLFRNPLADPYILGVSSGASLGVALITMGKAVQVYGRGLS